MIRFHASKGNISSVPLCLSIYLSLFGLDSPSSCLSPCELAVAGFACLIACFSLFFPLHACYFADYWRSLCVPDYYAHTVYLFQSRYVREDTCEMVWPLFLISLLIFLSFTPTFKIKFVFLSEDGWLQSLLIQTINNKKKMLKATGLFFSSKSFPAQSMVYRWVRTQAVSVC